MAWGNATIVEIAYTIPSLIGAIIAIVVAYLMYGDRRAYRESGSFRRNSALDSLSYYRLRSKIIVAFLLVGYVVIGFLAMTTPPPRNQDPITWKGIVIASIFFASSVGLSIDSFLYIKSRRYRLQTMKHIDDARC